MPRRSARMARRLLAKKSRARGRAPDLVDNGGKTGAFQTFLHSPNYVRVCARASQHQLLRVGIELRKRLTAETPSFQRRYAVLYP